MCRLGLLRRSVNDLSGNKLFILMCTDSIGGRFMRFTRFVNSVYPTHAAGWTTRKQIEWEYLQKLLINEVKRGNFFVKPNFTNNSKCEIKVCLLNSRNKNSESSTKWNYICECKKKINHLHIFVSIEFHSFQLFIYLSIVTIYWLDWCYQPCHLRNLFLIISSFGYTRNNFWDPFCTNLTSCFIGCTVIFILLTAAW